MRKVLFVLMLVLDMVVASLGAHAGDGPHTPEATRHLAEDEVLAVLADLLVEGGAGYRQTERAAFLVVDETGTYRLDRWPADNRDREQRFRGTIPPSTIAIVHTHPANLRRPSYGDGETARRSGVPVLVLTPRDIFAATPDGRTVALLENRLWVGRGARGRRTP